jgi:hypothetical protein
MSMHDDRDTAITRDPMYQQVAQAPQGTMPPPQPAYGYQYGQPQYGQPQYGRRGIQMPHSWSETKPFFMTSEFLFTLLGIVGICITAAVAADLDSHRASVLVTALIVGYTVSRGIAKAGTRSRATDPRDEVDLSRSHDGHPHG